MRLGAIGMIIFIDTDAPFWYQYLSVLLIVYVSFKTVTSQFKIQKALNWRGKHEQYDFNPIDYILSSVKSFGYSSSCFSVVKENANTVKNKNKNTKLKENKKKQLFTKTSPYYILT